MSGVYLDYNASGLVRPEVLDVVARALADNGNPSAVHAAGRRARARIETARAQVAELVGADPTAVVFSSGGTESNAQAIVSALTAGCARLIVGATEHPCVAEAAAVSGVPVEVLPVDGNGVVDLLAAVAIIDLRGVLVGGLRQQHDRELQSLCLVNRHHPDRGPVRGQPAGPLVLVHRVGLFDAAP